MSAGAEGEKTGRGSVESGAPSDEIDAGSTGSPHSRYHIRILDDGTVVFTDLPPGLAEVASVVAGSAPGVAADTQGDDKDLR